MYPILGSFGVVNIYSHGLMMALGVIVGGSIVYFLARKQKLAQKIVFDLVIFSVVGGLVGARLAYFWLYYNQFNVWYEVFFVWQGGLVSFGGLIGGIVLAFLYLKQKRQNIWAWLDIGVIGLLIGWAIGRVGCFLSGDILGLIASNWLSVWGRWPIALLEGVWCLVAAGICWFAFARLRGWRPGMVFWSGLGLYGLGRLAVDFLKDEPVLLWQLKPGQIGAILTIIFALVMVFVLIKKGRKE